MKLEIAVLLLCVCALPLPVVSGEIEFFNGKDFSGFGFSSNSDDAPGKEFWEIKKNGNLMAYGDPDNDPSTRPQSGLYTKRRDYGNYELTFEYRYTGDKGGKNSGVWVLGGRDFVDSGGAFPASIEVQLRKGYEGDLLLKQLKLQPEPGFELSKDARRPKARLARRKNPNINPVGNWTPMKIRVETTKELGTAVSVWIDGKFVNKGIHAGRDKGRITFQSEGADIEWRKIRLLDLNN